jgi:mediator of RNA polymerase II transcription subunit 6
VFLQCILSQHASLFSLQTSLDILRKHRPDYTPRTGFVWPIVGDPNPAAAGGGATAADASKKKNQETEETTTTSSDSEQQPNSASGSKRPGEGSSKRMNMMLLMNAMHTTAMNSVITPPETAANAASVVGAESVTAETPSTAPTPAPHPLDAIGRAPSMQAESSKTSVKKKRKRESFRGSIKRTIS